MGAEEVIGPQTCERNDRTTVNLDFSLQENLPKNIVAVIFVMAALVGIAVVVATLAFIIFDTSTRIFAGESKVVMTAEAFACIPLGLMGYWGVHWLIQNHAPEEIVGITQQQMYSAGETLLFLVLPVAWGLGSVYRWRTRSRVNRGLDTF